MTKAKIQELTAAQQLESAESRAREVSQGIEAIRQKIHAHQTEHALRLEAAANGSRPYPQSEREAYRKTRTDLEMGLEDLVIESEVLSAHIASLKVAATQEQYDTLTDQFEAACEALLPSYFEIIERVNGAIAGLAELDTRRSELMELRQRISKTGRVGWGDERPPRVPADFPVDCTQLFQNVVASLSFHDPRVTVKGRPVDGVLYLANDQLKIRFTEERAAS